MLSVLLVLLPFGCANGPRAPQLSALTETVAAAKPATTHNDPETLIRNCGRPDNSADSVWVQPGDGASAIMSRSLTYNKAHLRITYISSGPKQWDFSALVDTETNHALDAGDLQNILRKRLPCAVQANGEIAQNAEQGKEAPQRRTVRKQPVSE